MKSWRRPPFWCAYARRGFVWFRILGWGLIFRDHRLEPMLFSDRFGYVKTLHVGPYCFELLRGDEYGK